MTWNSWCGCSSKYKFFHRIFGLWKNPHAYFHGLQLSTRGPGGHCPTSPGNGQGNFKLKTNNTLIGCPLEKWSILPTFAFWLRPSLCTMSNWNFFTGSYILVSFPASTNKPQEVSSYIDMMCWSLMFYTLVVSLYQLQNDFPLFDRSKQMDMVVIDIRKVSFPPTQFSPWAAVHTEWYGSLSSVVHPRCINSVLIILKTLIMSWVNGTSGKTLILYHMK